MPRAPLLAPTLAALLGCSGQQPPAPSPRPAKVDASAETGPAAPAAAYALSDPNTLGAGNVLALGEPGSLGVLVDGVRAVVAGGPPRFAVEVSANTLTHAMAVPARLGGGFLFRGSAALYTSPTFDGALRPLVTLPSGIRTVSLGPKGVFIRGANGERWAIALPSGARQLIDPPGAVDLLSTEDGRAAAITEAAGLQLSWDRGTTWRDFRTRLAGTPQTLDIIEGDLWIVDDRGRGYRMAQGGALIEFDRPPSAPPKKVRPPDPRWRGAEPPLRLAIRTGALVDPRTAVVAASGDIAWVDIKSGAIKRLLPGVLPPDLPCQAIEVLAEAERGLTSAAPDDVIVVCATDGRPSVILSGLIAGDGEAAPRVERTFPAGGPFSASDDGALAYAGPCSPAADASQGAPPPRGAAGPARSAAVTPAVPPGDALRVCARGPRGDWREHTIREDADPDGGAPLARESVRWVPRLDRSPLAILVAEPASTHDTGSGKTQPWRLGELNGDLLRDLMEDARPQHGSRDEPVDRTWSATEEGGVRGWIRAGRAIEILPDGVVVESPYRFPGAAPSSAFALVRAEPGARRGTAPGLIDGRAFQTVDRGRTWVEVATTPAILGRSSSARGCTRVGCDLGPWLRIGWEPTPPAPAPPPEVVALPPALPAAELRALTCKLAGEGRGATVPSSSSTFEDLGIGARRTPLSGEPLKGSDETSSYVRQVLGRGPVIPPHSVLPNADQAPAAMVHGFAADTRDSAEEFPRDPLANVVVLGPSRQASAFRREITFLEPLDPGGAIRSATFGTSALLPIARAAGVPAADLLVGYVEAASLAPILPPDPAGPTDVVFAMTQSDLGALVGAVRGGAVELAWAASPRGALAYAVTLPGGGRTQAAGKAPLAVLWIDDDGGAHVDKLQGGACTRLHELPPPPSSALYPANPDALAVDAQGNLALIRLPSGSDPPSATDPALLIPLGGGAPIPLAPWSTLTPDADPACRSDPSGHRAMIHSFVPWIRAGDLRPDPDALVSGMLARVRWSAARVCLEAIELPVRLTVTNPQASGVETIIVARFAAPQAAAEVTVALGAEHRQPLACSLAPM